MKTRGGGINCRQGLNPGVQKVSPNCSLSLYRPHFQGDFFTWAHPLGSCRGFWTPSCPLNELKSGLDCLAFPWELCWGVQPWELLSILDLLPPESPHTVSDNQHPLFYLQLQPTSKFYQLYLQNVLQSLVTISVTTIFHWATSSSCLDQWRSHRRVTSLPAHALGLPKSFFHV